jgi:sodium transport system permease protein
MPALIVPLLLFFTSQSTSDEELKGPVRIIIQSSENQIKSIINQSFKDIQFLDPDSSAHAIINGKADLQINSVKSGDRYKSLTIYYDSARRGSLLSYIKIHTFLKSYFDRSGSPIQDMQITSITIRNEAENKTLITLSLIVPIFLMVFAASSTMSAVTDMSSGEKERSTIETLLTCNVSHTTIILGKIFAAFIIGFTSIISLLCGLITCSHVYPQITGGISLLKFCGLTNIVLMLIMTSLAVILFSTVGMVIGLYAKSAKEGTILTLPVIVISSALSSGLIASDPFMINRLYLLIPVLNFSFLIRAAIYNHYNGLFIMISVFVNLAYAFIFLIISNYLLKKETVIFRS